MTDHDATRATPHGLSHQATLELLLTGELRVEGRLVDASNATLYCTVRQGTDSMICIYKPQAGERPLWDFPTGTLGRREMAAYAVSEALGWGIVPPTVWRDGPVGPGMVQEWIHIDPSVDLVDLVRSDRKDLQRMAVFDVVINNSDRKGGHILPTLEGELFGIDHGVAFSVESKVRTLLWQWEGDPVPPDMVEDLEQLSQEIAAGPLRETLRGLLSPAEIAAVAQRVDQLAETGHHPGPSPDWPAIPWPPF